ncbi:ABC transporter permease [Caballeronia zhejiangensis]|jgi:ABC-type spermidine/putrescine transport system permease subunit II|uniref:ABC transporter permease n=1 Tax=Caballeronia zhejiangensis TaxID=871203 RepID=UPI001FD42151|nr:ABC transporter permease [Caballeronia zhejiangensis]
MHNATQDLGLFSKTVAGLTIVFLLMPLVVVIPISFGASSLMTFPPHNYSLRWYRLLVEDSRWLSATVTSLQLGITVAFISTVLATMTAIGMFRYRGPAKAVLQALVMSPLVVPVIIIGVALFYLFSLLGMTGTLSALICAHTLLTFPYGVVVINAALERFDTRLEQAAMSMGANPVRTLWRVTLPAIRPSIVVAALFAFLISFDEVVMAVLLSSPMTLTIPKQMWNGIRFDLTPVIAAVSTVLLGFSSALVAIAEAVRRRSQGNT